MDDQEERTLVVIRHAKSSWPPGVEDIRRPLSRRGRRDAPEVGRWLKAQRLGVDRAWVSPAARTQQTWALVASQLDGETSHVLDERLYAAMWDEMLEVVRSVPEDRAVAALVGHNPGTEDLVATLAGPDSDPDALTVMRVKYPTAGVSVLRFAGSWSGLGPDSARLVAFVVPRG